jgi:hypothetical protein
MRRVVTILGGVAVLAILGVAAAFALQPRWFDHLEGRGVGARLDALVTAASDGATIDIRDAYPTDWDRAVVIGGYWPGSVANSELGFEYFDPDETLSYSEDPARILFVRRGDVLADVDVETFTFADDVVVITPEASEFILSRADNWSKLQRAP